MSVAAPSLPRARDDGLAQRVARCFSVSVLTTTISLATLGVLTAGFGVVAWFANVVATALGTLVSYRLNRQWVWRRRDASDPWREIVPFWAMSFAGLVLSTVLVAGAGKAGGPRKASDASNRRCRCGSRTRRCSHRRSSW